MAILNIIFIGDVVGTPGKNAVRDNLPSLIKSMDVDLVLANGENAASGLGLNLSSAQDLLDYGVDLISLGNHTWSKSEIFKFIEEEKNIIRPANVSQSWPGHGFTSINTSKGKLSFINLIGRVGMPPANCPFERAIEILEKLDKLGDGHMIIVDFHAEATSEKIALARYLDGKVSLVCGTHTHVQTNDEKKLPKGTGYITDVGMTGPRDSVIGMEIKSSIRRFVDKLPQSYKIADGRPIFNAIFAKIDERSGRTLHIEKINIE